MSIAEKVAAFRREAAEEIRPTPEVQAIIDSSAIKTLLDQLPQEWKQQTIITESGAKVVYDVFWQEGGLNKRSVFSVRADRIAFMGDFCKPHYSVLEGQDVTDKEKVEQHFLDAVANPYSFAPQKQF